MVNALRGLLIMLLMVFAFVMYPAVREAELSDDRAERISIAAVEHFVDSARSKGFVDVRDFEVFQRQLEASTYTFDILLEYHKKTVQPVYLDPNDPSTFQDTFEVEYEVFFTRDILSILYPSSAVPEDDPSRRFEMKVGDLFSVSITSIEPRVSSRLRSLLFTSKTYPVKYSYGGMVRSEAP